MGLLTTTPCPRYCEAPWLGEGRAHDADPRRARRTTMQTYHMHAQHKTAPQLAAERRMTSAPAPAARRGSQRRPCRCAHPLSPTTRPRRHPARTHARAGCRPAAWRWPPGSPRSRTAAPRRPRPRRPRGAARCPAPRPPRAGTWLRQCGTNLLRRARVARLGLLQACNSQLCGRAGSVHTAYMPAFIESLTCGYTLDHIQCLSTLQANSHNHTSR